MDEKYALNSIAEAIKLENEEEDKQSKVEFYHNNSISILKKSSTVYKDNAVCAEDI